MVKEIPPTVTDVGAVDVIGGKFWLDWELGCELGLDDPEGDEGDWTTDDTDQVVLTGVVIVGHRLWLDLVWGGDLMIDLFFKFEIESDGYCVLIDFLLFLSVELGKQLGS